MHYIYLIIIIISNKRMQLFLTKKKMQPNLWYLWTKIEIKIDQYKNITVDLIRNNTESVFIYNDKKTKHDKHKRDILSDRLIHCLNLYCLIKRGQFKWR